MDEGRLFAAYLNTAADGLFKVLLGSSYQRIIAEAYLSPGHGMSFEHVVFAETPRGIGGMISCFSFDQRRRFSDLPPREAAGIHILRMGALSLLGQGLLRFIETLSDGDFYVESVAVSTDERGMGIGSRLLDHAETLALGTGCARIVLDVAEDKILF